MRYLGGLQRADLVILGARPSMGKSSLAVNMAVNAAKSGHTCGVFSLEMTREQLAMRVLASEAGIDSHRLRLGLYTHLEEGRIIDSIGRLSDLPVFIDDTPYQGMADMRSKASLLALERDPNKRGVIIQKFEDFLRSFEDNHWITVYWGKFFWLVHKDIKGFNAPNTVQYVFKHEDLWLDR